MTVYCVQDFSLFMHNVPHSQQSFQIILWPLKGPELWLSGAVYQTAISDLKITEQKKQVNWKSTLCVYLLISFKIYLHLQDHFKRYRSQKNKTFNTHEPEKWTSNAFGTSNVHFYPFHIDFGFKTN